MNENKITQAQLEALIDQSETETVTFWGREMVSSFKLPCGFTVLGRAAVVDPANFDYQTGLTLCREDAINRLWKLEGYRLQWRLHEQGAL